MRRLPILLPIVVLTLLLVGTSSVAARSKVSLGAASQDSRNMAVVDDFIDRTGARPALWALWSDWGDRGGKTRCLLHHGTCAFPLAAARQLRKRGITPFIWWQPTDPVNPLAGTYERYKNVINGKHDKYIRHWAKAAKKYGKPVIVRFAHEMNGTWFPWSLSRFDNTPWRFRQAWQRIVSRFRAVGARNVKFLWSPFKQHCAGCPRLKYAELYPGDAYVDYVGITTLNWGTNWVSLNRLLKNQIKYLREVTRKPIILPEVASNWEGGDKAKWIRRGYKQAYRRWPGIRAIVYFDYDTSPSGQPDWRLVMPPDGSALEAYRTIASRKVFQASFP